MDVYLHMKVRKGQSERHARGRSRDHTTSMQLEESQWVADDGGRTEPMKRQARRKREVGPEVDGGPARKPGDESAEGLVETRSRNFSYSSPLSRHIPVDIQVWWGRMS